MGTIPADWLIGPATVEEAEERLAEVGAPDLCLRQWRAFLGRMRPGDELWTYYALAPADPASDEWDVSDMRQGYAIVRDGEALETIATEWD
jgi:hypothetical protein